MGFNINGTPKKVEKVSAAPDDVMPDAKDKVSEQKVAAMANAGQKKEEEKEDGAE